MQYVALWLCRVHIYMFFVNDDILLKLRLQKKLDQLI